MPSGFEQRPLVLAAIGGWQMWRAPVLDYPTAEQEWLRSPREDEELEERMRKLDRLREQGLVGEDEYAEQRRRLLNEI